MTTKDTAILVAIGVGGFLLWKFFQKGKEFVESGADMIARPIAYVISQLTLPPAVHVPGGVVMADGGYISFDAIVQAGSKVSGDGTFAWRGTLYKVKQPRRDDGNYDAVRA